MPAVRSSEPCGSVPGRAEVLRLPGGSDDEVPELRRS